MSEIQSVTGAHHARNRELLKLIASKGADLNEPRDIDLHFWTSTEEGARGLSAALEARGYFHVSMKQTADDPGLWNIDARVQASPVSVAAVGFVDNLAQLAADHGGEFDGWGTSILNAVGQLVGLERGARVSHQTGAAEVA